MRDSLRPPIPLVLPWAAMAAIRSKKSKMILVRASESTLIGMNVANASRAMFESGHTYQTHFDPSPGLSHLAPPPGTAHTPPR